MDEGPSTILSALASLFGGLLGLVLASTILHCCVNW
jgi:hypothetical protein